MIKQLFFVNSTLSSSSVWNLQCPRSRSARAFNYLNRLQFRRKKKKIKQFLPKRERDWIGARACGVRNASRILRFVARGRERRAPQGLGRDRSRGRWGGRGCGGRAPSRVCSTSRTPAPDTRDLCARRLPDPSPLPVRTRRRSDRVKQGIWKYNRTEGEYPRF